MLASPILLGIAAGLALGGRWQRLAEIRIKWWPLLAVALGIRLVALVLGEAGLYAYVIAFAAVLAGAIANRSLPGMPLVVIGSAANLLVVLLNGGMPNDPAAVALAGTYVPADGLHIPMDASTRLAFLANVIPVPWIARVYSPGDLLLAAAGFWLPFKTLRRV